MMTSAMPPASTQNDKAQTAKISVECPTCGLAGKVPEAAVGKRATCPECRAQFMVRPLRVVRDPDELPRHDCPVCADQRLAPALGELGELSCPACHGSFLPAAAAATLVSAGLGLDPEMLPELETFSRTEAPDCPQCSTVLTRITLKGVAVDWCSSCGGIWLDAGELHRLTRGRRGTPVARPELRDQLSDTTRLGLEKLGEYREYRLHQDREINSLPELVSTALLAWDRANWYDLRGPLGTVAVVAEERRGWWDDLIRNLFDHRARKLLVLNNSMTEVLLELSRSWYVLAASMEVKIAGPGRRLGRVQRLLNPILRTYELKDAKGEVFAVVRAPVWRYWHYSILDPARGRKLGAIRKCWSGSLTEYFTRGDRFSIDFGDHDWQLEQRCVLLAAMIAIDLDSFESRGAD